ncbi:FV3-083R [Symbiodinium pilosum]|uniref:FV3-083R protein n=1 Tax=Symbiodinium pilosum TaxID=2952 RepID=A0A812SNJ7_SYMPI|nr:FV3-083R [Symbiodinium pilosum]
MEERREFGFRVRPNFGQVLGYIQEGGAHHPGAAEAQCVGLHGLPLPPRRFPAELRAPQRPADAAHRGLRAGRGLPGPALPPGPAQGDAAAEELLQRQQQRLWRGGPGPGAAHGRLRRLRARARGQLRESGIQAAETAIAGLGRAGRRLPTALAAGSSGWTGRFAFLGRRRGAAAALVGTAWAIEGGLTAASHLMGFPGGGGGGTDRVGGAAALCDAPAAPAARAQPAPRVRARAARQQPSPFGINPVRLPRPQGQSSGSEGSRASRQSRPLNAEPSFDQRNSPDARRESTPRRAMENVTQAVQDELMGSLDYKLATSNVNYVQSRRDVQYFPSSLSTFTPTTSRVARIPLTSGMDFIDPESVKIAFRVRNTDGGGGQVFPGSFEGNCFIKRVQLFSNGQRTDDISEYGRCCWLYSLLKPQEWYNGRAYEGFYPTNLGNPPAILDGNYRDVLIPPTLIGLFQSGKMLPPQLNLVLEIEFAEAADALWPGGTGSASYSIENVRVLASQVTLDSALVESFNKVLLSGRSLVFSYPTMHTQVSSIPAGTSQHSVTVARAYTKLMGAFVTFKDDDDALGEVMNLEYPAVNGQLEYQMQLGALQFPRYPMASLAEHHHFLEIMAGTYDSKIKNMRLNRLEFEDTQFIAAFPVERVPKHPLSGISTRSGDLARFTFKNLQPDRAQKLYIHLISYQIVTLSGAGVSVLD